MEITTELRAGCIIDDDSVDSDRMTTEWNGKMTTAVIEQTWSAAIRKMADTIVLVAVIATAMIAVTALTVSLRAGCITAGIAFLSMAAALEIAARLHIRRHKNAVLDAATATTDSLRPIKPSLN